MQAYLVAEAGGRVSESGSCASCARGGRCSRQEFERVESIRWIPRFARATAAHAKQPLLAVLGLDMAGVVEMVGAGVTRFQPGDEVYGVGGVGGLQGTLAELIAVDADLLAHKPRNISMREAAALPLITITAWEGLRIGRRLVRAARCWFMLGLGAWVTLRCSWRGRLGRMSLLRCRRRRRGLLRDLGLCRSTIALCRWMSM